MITAIDSSVLLDVFARDPTFCARSQAALRSALAEGGLIACEVVWAEVAASFSTAAAMAAAMATLTVDFSTGTEASAAAAGAAWKTYRRRGGPRDRVVADFLIGGHAEAVADRLLTRDRGFYRTYFPRLTIFEP